ncbi:phosphotransferase [Microbacterium sp. NPDC076911]|uniref:phosphotransferase n=1 Tax=Microbacterium sp. NPDC076911 TaxID=3154958 RepID=UPI0034430C60
MEEQLAGGNMAPVFRVGATVRRETGEWTPAVHRLLAALTSIDEVPAVIGLDDFDREVLTFLPGDMLAGADATVLWSERILVSSARLLRRMHDASVELAGDPSLVWRSPAHRPREVICHNDFAPYNLIVRGGVLSGVIDFDFASPGSRVWDLAYLAYRLVPFAEDAPHAESLDRSQRLAALINAYGMSFAPDDVVSVIVQRLDELESFTLARASDTGHADFLAHAAMYRRDAERLKLWNARNS